MLLPNLIPLIDVTFSTPTGDYAHRSCRFAVGPVASKRTDRLGTFLSNPVVKKKWSSFRLADDPLRTIASL
jgi:hypothetical protein